MSPSSPPAYTADSIRLAPLMISRADNTPAALSIMTMMGVPPISNPLRVSMLAIMRSTAATSP